ncbi:Uncharacterised protein [Bordetella pertussis]|nr:Uncharacterised protein [Bordetella pertussis]CFW11787.1 Uncharacterised protein [Bordetella pertussis]CFW43016.1 Uncharacterised protein [Bordetella pertussis]
MRPNCDWVRRTQSASGTSRRDQPCASAGSSPAAAMACSRICAGSAPSGSKATTQLRSQAWTCGSVPGSPNSGHSASVPRSASSTETDSTPASSSASDSASACASRQFRTSSRMTRISVNQGRCASLCSR